MSQVNRFVNIRRQKITKFLGTLVKYSEGGQACDLNAELKTMTNNVICRIAMSTRCFANANDSSWILRPNWPSGIYWVF